MAKPSAKPDDCRGIIVGPGVNQPDPFPRFFTRQRDGSFTAAPGDFGKLTFAGGSYRLTEVDQTIWQFRSDKLLDYVQDANANRVTLAYTDGRLTRLTHSADKQLLIDYNAAGRIWHVTDTASPGAADDRVTTYEYDLSGEHLLRVIAPGDRVTEYAYEIGGSLPRKYALTSVQFADGTHDFFVYDDFGRLQETSRDNGAERVRYAYDDTGNVTVADATDHVTVLSFGLGGQLAKVRDGNGNDVHLEFDNRFQLASLVGPSGERYEYSYDSRGNLVGFVDPLRNVVSFTYDPIFNQLTGFTDARGNGIQYAYDAHGDLERITYEDDSNEVFTYYDDGNVKTWTNRRGQTVAYAYNAAGQLTSKDYTRDYAGPRLLSIRRAALEFPDDAFQTFADHSAAGAGSP